MKSLFARITTGVALLWSTAAWAQPWERNGGLGALPTSLIIAALVLLLVFLIGREILCWYLKINQSIALLTEIRDLLKADRSHVSGQERATGNQ